MPSERKYSVSEIDQMRRAVNEMLMRPGTVFRASERTVAVEERLRTYMLNGTDPEELRKSAAEHIERMFADHAE
jgi:hypothetical protein